MSAIPQQSVSRFYDELAADYHLIYADWAGRNGGPAPLEPPHRPHREHRRTRPVLASAPPCVRPLSEEVSPINAAFDAVSVVTGRGSLIALRMVGGAPA
ncbi:hypothetical protein GA0115257_119749 [Streptomyces sp. LcepLS]|nr:hypothetical protein GA0115251_108413 [Streptomyces sp. TverLS-915]SCF48155.1 hypothetical protein GA0115257_119749 [Streptomyces sp. LcepLS]